MYTYSNKLMQTTSPLSIPVGPGDDDSEGESDSSSDASSNGRITNYTNSLSTTVNAVAAAWQGQNNRTRGTVVPREDVPGECCFLLFIY